MQPVIERLTLGSPLPGEQGIQLWATGATQALAQTVQQFGFRLNRVAPLDGSEPFTGDVTFEANVTIDGSLFAAHVVAGDPGTEGTGITVGGTTYESSAKVSDIGGTNIAQLILHRHSTTWAPIIVGSRTNSDDETHSIVTNNMVLFDLYAVGHDGTDYAIGGRISFQVDGTPGNNDMPGRISFYTTPDGSQSPIERMRITNAGVIRIYDPGGTDYGAFYHDGTNFYTAFTNTTNYYINGVTVFDVTASSQWNVRSPRLVAASNFTANGGTDFLFGMTPSAAGKRMTFYDYQNTRDGLIWDLDNKTWSFKNGSIARIYDSDNSDYAELYHTGSAAVLATVSGHIRIYGEDSGGVGRDCATFDPDGAAQLMYAGSTKVGTGTDGFNVYGYLHFTTTPNRGIYVEDTRSTDTAPSGYGRVIRWDFKQTSTVSMTDTILGTPSTYAGVQSFSPWVGDSGGPDYQMAFYVDSSSYKAIAVRMGTDAGGWGTWGRVPIFLASATTANAGAQTLPSNPVGFFTLIYNGTTYKIPYYAN